MSDESPASTPPGPLPSPWALWTVFYDFPRWFLARGYPPTLRDSRRWVRALRVTVLIGALTLPAAWGIAALEPIVSPWDGWYVFFIAALPLGVLVLLPMARWFGRPWWLALWAVPLAGLALKFQIEVAESTWINAWIDGDPQQRGATFGFVIAAGMLGLWPPRKWCLPLLCAVSALLVWPLSIPLNRDFSRVVAQFLPGFMSGLLITATDATLIFWSVTLPLGIWLWDPPDE